MTVKKEITMSELINKTNLINYIRDKDWVGQSFLLAGYDNESNKDMLRWRKFSSAELKYTGPGLGRNTVLNSAPGFTPLCDIPRPGVLADKPVNLAISKELSLTGMGARYSEMIDDNKQVVHLRFGVVKYKGLITFFTSFYDNESALLAKYGRTGIGYYFGAVLGVVFTIPMLFLMPIILAGNAWNFLIGRQSTSFMDFKPTMSLFWTRTQVIYNNIGAQLGVIPRIYENTGHWGKGKDEFSGLEDTQGIESYRKKMADQYPQIFDAKTGLLDVYNVALGAARAEYKHRQIINRLQETAKTNAELRERIFQLIENPQLDRPKPSRTFKEYLQDYLNGVLGSISGLSKESDSVETDLTRVAEETARGNSNALNDYYNQQQQAQQNAAGGGAGAGVAETTATSNVDAAAQQAAQQPVYGVPPYLAKTNTPTSSLIASQPIIPTEVDANGQAISTNANQQTVTGLSGVSSTGTLASSQPKAPRQEMMTTLQSKDDGNGGTVWELFKGWFAEYGQNWVIEAQNGAAFLNLAVNYTGAGTASFSNSLKPTTIEGFFNGVSGNARDVRVSMADFNTGFGFMDAAMGMVRNVFGGVMDMVQMSGLLALGGNAFADFPKQWDNSTATFPTASFQLELRTPYGDELSRYINLYPVIAALLSGALPQSTGPKSYTSPNVCECYSRGVCAIRMGMITDLSITAGTGNLGYSQDRAPLAFDVSFTVADLSSIMHAPIGNGFNPFKPLRRVMDDDNPFNDYISTITGLHMRDMIDPSRKFAIRAAARWGDYQMLFSPSHIASRMADSAGVRLLNKLIGYGAVGGV